MIQTAKCHQGRRKGHAMPPSLPSLPARRRVLGTVLFYCPHGQKMSKISRWCVKGYDAWGQHFFTVPMLSPSQVVATYGLTTKKCRLGTVLSGKKFCVLPESTVPKLRFLDANWLPVKSCVESGAKKYCPRAVPGVLKFRRKPLQRRDLRNR